MMSRSIDWFNQAGSISTAIWCGLLSEAPWSDVGSGEVLPSCSSAYGLYIVSCSGEERPSAVVVAVLTSTTLFSTKPITPNNDDGIIVVIKVERKLSLLKCSTCMFINAIKVDTTPRKVNDIAVKKVR